MSIDSDQMRTHNMGEQVQILSSDGIQIGAWRELPASAPHVGLVIVQEIFGVTAHIRAVVEHYASLGYAAIAPAFFDRVAPDVELAVDEAGMTRGRELVAQIGMDAPLRDVRAAAEHLIALGCHAVGVVGYCWGGAVAYLCATRLGLPAASYYGRLVPHYLHERPQAPLIFHFGDADTLIPASALEQIASALPGVPMYRYPAGHAFNRLGDPHGEPASAALALKRTLAFFNASLGAPE